MATFKCWTVFVVIMSLLGVSMASREEYKSFENFKLKYAKKYVNDEEHQQRFKIFLKNVEHINKHNLKHAARQVTYKMAINEYADIAPEEFQEINWTKYAGNPGGEQGATYIPPFNVQIPNSIDWRVLGAVSPVKKQQKCGSCWAFAATGALEGQHFRKTSQLIPLSEQNLIDCTLANYNNSGCRGGFKERAFIYVRDNAGIDTEQSYPYQAIENSECHFNESTVGAVGNGFVVMPKGDELAMTIAVSTVGPIGVDLNGKCLKLQFYEEGIYDDIDCSATAPLQHSVLIVGYGRDIDKGMDYWLIKNSWGAEWGMDGFVKIPRFQNYAGVANRASYPLV